MKKLDNLYALYELGRLLGGLRAMLDSKSVMDGDLATQSNRCEIAIKAVIGGEVIALPRSRESAQLLLVEIKALYDHEYRVMGDIARRRHPEQVRPEDRQPLDGLRSDLIKHWIDTFQNALSEEMKLLPLFSSEAKGNLSLDRLIEGASLGYPSLTLGLIDDFIKREIDEAGRCLAFARATACGFHILRAVEIAVKGYVLAAKGKLPNPPQRSWSTYIIELNNAGASSDVIDLLKILKTKRNPLMHPKDTLETDEAIGIFCICQSVMETLIAEVRSKGYETKFTDALTMLPTL